MGKWGKRRKWEIRERGGEKTGSQGCIGRENGGGRKERKRGIGNRQKVENGKSVICKR